MKEKKSRYIGDELVVGGCNMTNTRFRSARRRDSLYRVDAGAIRDAMG